MSENQSISSNSSTMEDPTRRFGLRTYSNRLRQRNTAKAKSGSVDQTPELIMCEPDPFVLEDESTEDMDASSRSNGQAPMTVAQLRASKGVKEEIYWKRKKKVVVPKVVPKVVGPDEVVHEIRAGRVGADGRIPSNEYVLSKKNLDEIKEYLSSDPRFKKYEEGVVEKKRRREERRAEVAQLTAFHGMHRFRLETLKKGAIPDACRKCRQDFQSEWDVIAHIRLTHSNYTDPVGRDRRSDFGGSRDYACTYCCTRFLTINHLARHTIDAHDKETIDPATNTPAQPLDKKALKKESLTLICHSCGKIVNNGPNGLRNHILSFHTKPEERPYPCDFDGCDRAFARARKLLEHRRVHKDLKLFECPHKECGKRFVKQQSMNEHVKAIHEKRKFKCKTCGHESISSSGRDYHRKKFHEKDKNRKCPHCTFATLTTGNLKLHIKNMHKDRLDENGQVRKEDEAKFMTFVHHDRYKSSQIIPLDQVDDSNCQGSVRDSNCQGPVRDSNCQGQTVRDSNCQGPVRGTRSERRKVKEEKSVRETRSERKGKEEETRSERKGKEEDNQKREERKGREIEESEKEESNRNNN